MAKRLIIVEFKEEAESLLGLSADPADALWLSLLPETSAYLKERGIPYVNTLDYFGRRSHEEGLSQAEKIMGRISETVALVDSLGVRHAYINTLTFYLRHYISFIIFNVEVISNCVRENGIKQIEVCRYRRSHVAEWVLTPDERVLADIAGVVAKYFNISLKEHFIPGKSLGGEGLVAWGRALYRMLFHHWALRQFKNLPHTGVLFYSLKFNFDRLARALKDCSLLNLIPERGPLFRLKEEKDGLEVHNLHLDYFLPNHDEKFQISLYRTTDTLNKLHKTEDLFTYKGFDFYSLVLDKVERDFHKQFILLNRKVRSLNNVLKTLSPALVVSPMAREISFALGELSRHLNIPSILISHGSHVPPKNGYDRMEWLDHGKGLIDTDYQYHLLQSPWALRYVEAMGSGKDYYKVMPVIFSRVDRAEKTEKQSLMYPASVGKKVIVHASTPKARGSNRLYIYETMDEYIQNMIDLIEAAKNIKGVFLVIRFRPSEYLKTEDLKKLLPSGEGYVIATEGSFNDYLTIADLMVSFSSTTIEEALLNRIPVLEYDPSGRYVHIEGSAWKEGGFPRKDSVYYIGEQSGLERGLRWIVEQHLSIKPDEGLFDRHVFDPKNTLSAEEFIRRLLSGKAGAAERLEEALVGVKEKNV